jgi:signal transduction histidine kinase
MLNDLTYRYKIPIRSTVAILLTAGAVAAALIYGAAEDLRKDVVTNAGAMSRVLARTLEPVLRRDDVWQAYEIITSPARSNHASKATRPESVVVLDDQERVFVSTDPKRFPVLTPIAQAGEPYASLRRLATPLDSGERIHTDAAGRLHMITPVVSDGIVIGALVVTYSGDIFGPLISRSAKRAALITLLVLGVLVPISWYWSVRMAKPLVQLADCMGKIGPNIPENLSCTLVQSRDELGQVATQFKRMLKELKEKQSIERQMISAERLAAVGRLAAGIAHEINNPLGGMLNALNNFRRYGKADETTQLTISLLERGLLQIGETVSALLVEAKPESRDLARADLEDVRTLASPSLQKKSARVKWDNRITDALPVSSTLVRQVVMNLVLNAANAIAVGGHIGFEATQAEGHLRIAVENDGRPIPHDKLARLFEPFASGRPDGTGLGLWVTYQIVQQLGGTIEVNSEPDLTQFLVKIPLTK